MVRRRGSRAIGERIGERPQGQRGLEEAVPLSSEEEAEREFRESRLREPSSPTVSFEDRVASWFRQREEAIRRRERRDLPPADEGPGPG